MKIKFIPLLNLHDHGAVCSILKINEISIMLDCGINETYDYSNYRAHQEDIKNVDYILLSHSEIQYAGGLPYVFLELGCQAAVYATLPISDLSLVNIFDFFIIRTSQKIENDQKLYLRLYKNVANVYDSIKEVKYFQHIVLKGVKKQAGTGIEKEYEFSIKPYPIGHTVGACAWSITKHMRTILYLVTYNHADGKSVDGMNIQKFEEKTIDLLITNSNSISTEFKKLRDKEKKIKALMDNAFKNNGNIIFACPSAAKIYDVLLLLIDLWPNQVPCTDPIYICHTFEGLIQLAHSQIEFLRENITEKFYCDAINPFRKYLSHRKPEEESDKFNNVKLCRSISENEIKTNGKLIVTTTLNILYGEQRKYLNTNNKNDLLIITEDNTFHREIMEDFIQKRDMAPKKELYDARLFSRFENYNSGSHSHTESNSNRIQTESAPIREEQKSNKDLESFFAPLFIQKKFPSFAYVEKKIDTNKFGEVLPEEIKEGFAKYDLRTKNTGEDESKTRTTKFENYFFKGDFNECFPKRGDDFHHPSMNIKREIIDLSATSDGKSMIKIINQLNPKNIIAINGSEIENKLIADHISGRHGIIIPKSGKESELEFISNNLNARIEPEYLGEIKMGSISSKTTEFKVDRLRKHEVKLVSKSSGMDIELKTANGFYEEEDSKDYKALGNFQLEKFQEFVDEHSFNTIFKNGALLVNKNFEVKKAPEQLNNGNLMEMNIENLPFDEQGKIVISGNYSKDYLEIRNLFYKFSNLH